MSDSMPILDYDLYNREERYLCSHLFRLLHEPVDGYRPLRLFLCDDPNIRGFRIFAEVALIRDAYEVRRNGPPTLTAFMDAVVRLVTAQEELTGCRLYSELPPDLRTSGSTHPRQILLKGNDRFNDAERKVYGAIQGIFNAKPDMAICIGRSLIVFEAKLTLGFDQEQLRRTRRIAEIWAKLLHGDLGFESVPGMELRTLGMSASKPSISWERVLEIAEGTYPEHDRTRQALAHAVAHRR